MDSEPTLDPFAVGRLPSVSQISSAFVALGGPPTPFRVSPAVFDVLRFIGALGIHARTSPSATLVEIKPLVWKGHFIEPWLKALLITYLVPTMETSPTSLEIRRDVLWSVPWCLNSFIDIPFQFVLSESSDITCTVTPQLQYLFVRVWLEVLGEGHAACGRWSMLLLKLNLKHGADANPHANPELLNTHTLGALKIENIPAFRCYLVTMTSQLSSAGDDSLSAFSTFMYLLADVVPRAKVVNSQPPGHDRQGIYGALVDETLCPLIHLLTKVLRIRRSVKGKDEFYRKNKIDPILLFAIANRVEFAHRFVESVAKAYLIANANGVNEIIGSYVDKLSQLAMDEKDNLLEDVGLITSKEKYPILVFNLDAPGMPPPDVWIEAVGNDVAAGFFKPSTGTGPVPVWRATTERKLFVIALLPGKIGFAQESAISFNLSWPPK
ncbi:hypothetical protein AAF712_008521 [Marasmius tenuissimus]|uniref:Uncharacterized protein n=1 Tax=Marasmius tenuissimus TaxID=585030 RepID=A0ABR2ZTX1_9AGAR